MCNGLALTQSQILGDSRRQSQVNTYKLCVNHSVMSDSLEPPWTVAHQASLSMEFSRQVHWSGLLFPSPRHLPNPGIKLGSLALQADSLPTEPLDKMRPQYKRHSGIDLQNQNTMTERGEPVRPDFRTAASKMPHILALQDIPSQF